ncbi:MAG: GerMN domain-containing protein [Candidatus Gribaldobacteria bacterium]|nr:GerMN domain-containing protein [Candidatus Gribaldobacteria bacterium]
MQKKYFIPALAVILVIGVAVCFRLFSVPKESPISQPLNHMQVSTTIKGNADVIKITKPLANEMVSSPLDIQGEARGTWYFEASFPVKILDLKGNEIATGIAQAKSDWMTESYVPFEVKLDFLVVADTDAVLVLKKDNPSGLPANDDQLEIPIRLARSDVMAVKVFFNNSKLDPEISCNKVFPVDRAIATTQAPARAVLELLLGGNLTDEEKADGFTTSINPDVKIQKLTIENGIAKVDFSEELEKAVGGSCRVSAIRAQIIETLKQFPSVDEVIISINGQVEDILQP